MRSMLSVVLVALISSQVLAVDVQTDANLLAEKIRVQVSALYDHALDQYNNETTAYNDVKASIEKDLALVDPELQSEIKTIAMDALRDAQTGNSSYELELSRLQSSLKNEEVHSAPAFQMTANSTSSNMANIPSGATSADSDRSEYATKAEFVSSLVSNRQSTRWVATSNQSLHSLKSTAKGIKRSYRIKASFLGVEVSAGPSIDFLKVYGTTAHVIGEGFEPLLSQYNGGATKSGDFDFYRRDNTGAVLKKNGKPVKRFMAYWCDVELYFESNYNGSGEFKVMGSGVDVYGTKRIANTVTLASRRIQVPEYIEGKTVTFQTLTEICNKEFLDAKYNNKMTVRQSMDQMMSNALAMVQFTHPNTKCAVDSQCDKWFKSTYLPQEQAKLVPRCAPEPREGYMGCFARGKNGSLCPVIEAGRARAGSYFGEYPCDVGYECVKTSMDLPYNAITKILYMPKGECRPKKTK